MGTHALRRPVGWMGTVGLVLLLQGVPPSARGAPITWETASHTVSKVDLIEGTVVLALSGDAGATVTGGTISVVSPSSAPQGASALTVSFTVRRRGQPLN